MVQTSLETGGSFVMDLSKDVVMGHEFCAEVLDYGPNTNRDFKPGTRVCSFPHYRAQRGFGHGGLFQCSTRRLLRKYGAYRVYVAAGTKRLIYRPCGAH